MIRGYGCETVRLAVAVTFVVGTLTLTAAATGPVTAAQPTEASIEDVLDDHNLVHTAQDIEEDQDEDGDENETIRHRNPDQYETSGDLDRLEGWLEGRLQSQLENSAIELSEGEAELARELLDEEYRERLGQYAEVTGETDGEGNPDTFEDARDEQERLVDAVDEYEQEKEAYESAREDGDDEQAREHARNLEDLWSEIDDVSRELDTNYDAMSEETDADLSAADAAVGEVHQSIETEQDDIRDEQFLETELTVESDESTISFLEPLTATGELQTADETAIADEEVRLEIGNATERVETDSSGTFELEYRPTTLPLETDELPITFVPEDGSEYLGSETSVNVSVEQDEPTISSLNTSDEVAYRDNVPVSGEISVGDEPVDDVQLSVTLNGEEIGVVNASNGSFEESVEIPESVPAGEGELEVSFALEDRALAQTATSETISVRETETEMAVNATRLQTNDLRVDGTLETADGAALENESVEIQVAGTPVETAGTADDGEFAATVAVPSSANDTVTVDAQYDDQDSNLASAEAETEVSFPRDDGASLLGSPWLWLGLGALGMAIGGGAWWYRRSSSSGEIEIPSIPDDVASAPEQQSETDPTLALLSAADDNLSSNQPNEAVQFGYAAVRRTAGTTIRDDGLTHWEFYHRLQQSNDESLTENQQGFLRDLTSEYERAAFTPDSTSERTAASLLERARRFCTDEDGRGGGDAGSTSD